MVKLLVLDIDGTLVNKQKEIPEENIRAIEYAKKKGVLVALNSGRPHQSMMQYAKQLGLSGPMISSNGAFIQEIATGKVLSENLVDGDSFEKVILSSREVGCCASIYSGERIIAEKMDDVILFYQTDSGKLPKEQQFHVGLVPNLLTDEGIKRDGVLKIEISGLTQEMSPVFHEKLADIKGLCLVDCFGGGMEITHALADKAQGTARLAGLYGIKQSEVMAMGDSPNDTAMLHYAGVSYVMGNARECIRCLFSKVADTNNNSGVAKAIYAEI